MNNRARSWTKHLRAGVFLLLTGLFLAGCQGQPGPSPSPSASSEVHQHEGHHHEAPHQGTLIVFGEEFAHLELVLDSETGVLTVYSLDGEASSAVPLETSSLELLINGEHSLVLKAVADPLTGDTESKSSRFEGTLEQLKGESHFHGLISKLEIKGQSFEDVEFSFPEGNESEAHHDSDAHREEHGSHPGLEEEEHDHDH